MIGGPNGAGKTTSAYSLMPDLLSCKEYVNADAIAAGLSPFDPDSTSLQAGKLMLKRIHNLAEENEDFAFETTMFARSFVPFLKKCKHKGYDLTLLFIWLESSELAVSRVKDRVNNGGNHIPENVVCRRYSKSINHFINLYLPLADSWSIFDNSYETPEMIAMYDKSGMVISNQKLWYSLEELKK